MTFHHRTQSYNLKIEYYTNNTGTDKDDTIVVLLYYCNGKIIIVDNVVPVI